MSNSNSRENSTEKERYEDKNIVKMSNNNQIRRTSDDIRNKETERKHIIWDTDRDRKDVILRKNIDKDNKLDAKRNHQKNQSCFVFGSSTPRSINLDNITTLGPISFRQYQQSMLSTTPINTYECNDDNKMIKRRPHSMIYATENTDESNYSYDQSPYQKSQTLNSALRSEQAKACLTMTSIPEVNFNNNNNNIRYNNNNNNNYHYYQNGFDNNKYSNKIDDVDGQNLMTQSLVLLPSTGRRRHPELTPVIPKEKDFQSPKELIVNKLSTGPKRAISMTRLDQLAKPRQRYLEETLRSRNSGNYSTNNLSPNNNNNNNNCMVRSMHNLPTRPFSTGPKSSMRKAASKDGQLSSLSRPISSLSGASEASTPSSSVIMRSKTARKPRPVSIAACASVRQNETPTSHVRESRVDEKSKLSTAQRPNRARSAGSSSTKRVPLTSNDNILTSTPKPPPPRKPAHVKAAAAARKTAKQQQQQEQHQKEQTNDDKDIKNEFIDKPVLNGVSKEENGVDELIKLEPDLQTNENKEELIALNSEENILDTPNKYSDDLVDIKSNLIEDQVNKLEIINNVNINSNQNEFIENTDESFVNNLNNENNNEEQLVNVDNSTTINNNNVQEQEINTSSKKDISVEEYKRILAEKRKQAREQAEREAEQERLRIEQLQREEEERERQFEEESRRLAEEHRRMEQEKLEKAIQEQQIREEEERKRKEEEQRLKLEKEEQEARAREEAERARIELEERLRKDEEERLLRKKRVEAIMIRTRKNKETSPNSEGSRSPDLNTNDSPAKNNVLVTHNVYVEN